MRRPIHLLLVSCALAAPISFAADSAGPEVAREIGAMLAWRMGPEVAEERCRDIDPAGVEARQSALKSWLGKNAALIKTVDERVAEIAPLAFSSVDPAKVVGAVRAQVKEILLEPLSAEADAAQLKAACQEDAKPTSARWGSNGVAQVHNSLAALYDWKIQTQQK